MSCLCDSIKKAFNNYKKKNKEKNKVNKVNKETKETKETKSKYVFCDIYEIEETNQQSLGEQKECCVCFESINESLLNCGHNIHIICIIKSKKICCPLCGVDVSLECKEHIKKCNNKKCICKSDMQEIYDLKLSLAHDFITYYIDKKYNDINFLKSSLKNIGIKNIDEIMINYGLAK